MSESINEYIRHLETVNAELQSRLDDAEKDIRECGKMTLFVTEEADKHIKALQFRLNGVINAGEFYRKVMTATPEDRVAAGVDHIQGCIDAVLAALPVDKS